jgi:hypothetical protein
MNVIEFDRFWHRKGKFERDQNARRLDHGTAPSRSRTAVSSAQSSGSGIPGGGGTCRDDARFIVCVARLPLKDQPLWCRANAAVRAITGPEKPSGELF